jgi:hypothetical protein
MNLYIALKSILSLFGLWFFVYYLWRDYRIDAFREHVFSIRDRMFLYAANGNISFDHPAYTILRNRMNVLLRYGHEFTLTRMILVLVTHVKLKSETIVKWEAEVAQLPDETQRIMKEFSVCVAVAVLQHMVYYSFFRYILVRPFMFLIKPFQVREIVERPKVVSSVERLESDALEQEARHVAQTHAAVA